VTTRLELLLEELIPVRPDHPGGTHSLWTQQEQDRHWEDLADAINVPVALRPVSCADCGQRVQPDRLGALPAHGCEVAA
jgi:hypothetical protein